MAAAVAATYACFTAITVTRLAFFADCSQALFCHARMSAQLQVAMVLASHWLAQAKAGNRSVHDERKRFQAAQAQVSDILMLSVMLC